MRQIMQVPMHVGHDSKCSRCLERAIKVGRVRSCPPVGVRPFRSQPIFIGENSRLVSLRSNYEGRKVGEIEERPQSGRRNTTGEQ
jgi:hypothetical protein